MIFSRIGRSLSRSHKGAILGVRSSILYDAASTGRNIDGGGGVGVEVIRRYLSSVGAGKQFVPSKTHLSDDNFLATNLGLHRLYSSETPKKKNYENYYPKDKKEIPKGEEQKSQSKGDSGSGDQGYFEKYFMKQYQILAALIFIYGLLLIMEPAEQKQKCKANHLSINLRFRSFSSQISEGFTSLPLFKLYFKLLKPVLNIGNSIYPKTVMATKILFFTICLELGRPAYYLSVLYR